MATDEQAALLAIQIKDTSIFVNVEENPVAQYAHFCKQYNEPCNIVDGKAYEVPDLTSCGYKCFRSLWTWWTVGWRNISGINCNSSCCLCETLLYLLSLLYPLALFMLTLFSIMNYALAPGRNDYYWDYKGEWFGVFKLLIPTVLGYLIPVLCFGYTVLYMVKFTRLVERNFNLVPRNRIFSNMIYVRNLHLDNKYLEISGHLAAALRRNELSYD